MQVSEIGRYLATCANEPDLKTGTACAARHSFGTDDVDINDSNNRLSGRARLSDTA